MSEAICDDRFSDTSDDVEATVGELRREAKIRQTLPWFLSAVLHALVLAGFWMTLLVIQSEDSLVQSRFARTLKRWPLPQFACLPRV